MLVQKSVALNNGPVLRVVSLSAPSPANPATFSHPPPTYRVDECELHESIERQPFLKSVGKSMIVHTTANSPKSHTLTTHEGPYATPTLPRFTLGAGRGWDGLRWGGMRRGYVVLPTGRFVFGVVSSRRSPVYPSPRHGIDSFHALVGSMRDENYLYDRALPHAPCTYHEPYI